MRKNGVFYGKSRTWLRKLRENGVFLRIPCQPFRSEPTAARGCKNRGTIFRRAAPELWGRGNFRREAPGYFLHPVFFRMILGRIRGSDIRGRGCVISYENAEESTARTLQQPTEKCVFGCVFLVKTVVIPVFSTENPRGWAAEACSGANTQL